jgi:hypothetical protein
MIGSLMSAFVWSKGSTEHRGEGAAEVGVAGMPQGRADNVTVIPKRGMTGPEKSVA